MYVRNTELSEDKKEVTEEKRFSGLRGSRHVGANRIKCLRLQ